MNEFSIEGTGDRKFQILPPRILWDRSVNKNQGRPCCGSGFH